MEFDDWKDIHNYLPRWLQVASCIRMSFDPNSTVCYSTDVLDGVQDNSCHILEHALWAFKPSFDEFNYYKLIVQGNNTFLTGKYHETLLIAIGQDDNYNIFPMTFAIVEGETKEAMIWFFQLLHVYVTPQPNVYLIIDRRIVI